MEILRTPHLILRQLSNEDAPFLLSLMNEPAFLHYIGDRQVRNLEDAKRYIETGPVKSYRENGFGMYLVMLKENAAPIGLCGLVKRKGLQDIDLGFAFLSAYRGKGYGFESASAVLDYAKGELRIEKIVAITASDNRPSIALLGKLGFRYKEMVRLSSTEPAVKLFVDTSPTPTNYK